MMWSVFADLCKEKGVSPSSVAVALGWSKSTISAWKNGKYTPKQDKLMQIADYFDVSLYYLLTGEKEAAPFYDDPDTEALAQAIMDNRDLRMLFSIAKDATPDQMRMGYAFFKAIKDKEVHEE